jgi:hypothetical protein
LDFGGSDHPFSITADNVDWITSSVKDGFKWIISIFVQKEVFLSPRGTPVNYLRRLKAYAKESWGQRQLLWMSNAFAPQHWGTNHPWEPMLSYFRKRASDAIETLPKQNRYGGRLHQTIGRITSTVCQRNYILWVHQRFQFQGNHYSDKAYVSPYFATTKDDGSINTAETHVDEDDITDDDDDDDDCYGKGHADDGVSLPLADETLPTSTSENGIDAVVQTADGPAETTDHDSEGLEASGDQVPKDASAANRNQSNGGADLRFPDEPHPTRATHDDIHVDGVEGLHLPDETIPSRTSQDGFDGIHAEPAFFDTEPMADDDDDDNVEPMELPDETFQSSTNQDFIHFDGEDGWPLPDETLPTITSGDGMHADEDGIYGMQQPRSKEAWTLVRYCFIMHSLLPRKSGHTFPDNPMTPRNTTVPSLAVSLLLNCTSTRISSGESGGSGIAHT